jgi:hypothetical protein
MELRIFVLNFISLIAGTKAYENIFIKRRWLDNSSNITNTSNSTNTSSHTISQDEGHSFFNIIISISLACILVYIIIYLYKKYLISNTRLDYEVNFIKDKYVHPSQELADFR